MKFDINLLSPYLEKLGHFDLFACDEVGRGPIAGPVVACSVQFTLDQNNFESFLNYLAKLNISDSKKLSSKSREGILNSLNIKIKKIKDKHVYTIRHNDFSFKFCVVEISPYEIDKINILQASLLAMKTATEKLAKEKNHKIILVDGNKNLNGKKRCLN